MSDKTTKMRLELIELIMAKGAFPKRSRVEAAVAELNTKVLEEELATWRAKEGRPERSTASAAWTHALRDIRSRSDFRPDDDDQPTEESALDQLADHLSTEFSISVRHDGRIEFWHLSTAVRQVIGDLPIVVYHFTSSAWVESIREKGLLPGFFKTNPHMNSYAGVYVTTQSSGPAVLGYCRAACAVGGGTPVRIAIETTLDELVPDEDDADISSGHYQYVLGHVPPSRILDITGC